MGDDPRRADDAAFQASDPGAELSGNPVVDGISQLLGFLGRILQPQGATPGSPAVMNDDELRDAMFRIAFTLLDGLGPVVRAGFEDDVSDGAAPSRPWPATVAGFVRALFLASFDAFGTTVVGLGMNASMAPTGNIRTIADCHVSMRWVLDAEGDDERQSRVLAVTRAGIDQARKSVAHSEQMVNGPEESALIAYVQETLDATEAELDELTKSKNLEIVRRPPSAVLFDRYLPDAYFMFALLSNVGAHLGPSPFLFYGELEVNAAINWDYKGVQVERAFWIAQATKIELENCELAASVCGWTGTEDLLRRIADLLGPVAIEAEKRFIDRRDPGRVWI